MWLHRSRYSDSCWSSAFLSPWSQRLLPDSSLCGEIIPVPISEELERNVSFFFNLPLSKKTNKHVYRFLRWFKKKKKSASMSTPYSHLQTTVFLMEIKTTTYIKITEPVKPTCQQHHLLSYSHRLHRVYQKSVNDNKRLCTDLGLNFHQASSGLYFLV